MFHTNHHPPAGQGKQRQQHCLSVYGTDWHYIADRFATCCLNVWDYLHIARNSAVHDHVAICCATHVVNIVQTQQVLFLGGAGARPYKGITGSSPCSRFQLTWWFLPGHSSALAVTHKRLQHTMPALLPLTCLVPIDSTDGLSVGEAGAGNPP